MPNASTRARRRWPCGDSEAYSRLAFTYAEMNRLDDALAAGRRAVACAAQNYYGYFALGYVSNT